MSALLIELNEALLGYRGHPVVRVERLAVRSGRCLGVFGPNGSGKTTLLRTIAGLLNPLAGTVRRTGPAVVGYLPQLRNLDLSWPMTAFDAAALATSSRSLMGWIGRHKRGIRDRLEEMGVASLAQRPFARLSGGQQQRVLLAGVLAIEPQVLLLDEPTEGLDQQSRAGLLASLGSLKQSGLAIVLITHDEQDLAGLADEVAHLWPARVDGEPSIVRFDAAKEVA